MNPRIRNVLSILGILGVVGALFGLTALNYRLAKDYGGGDSFLPRWNAARAWVMEGQSPYSEEVSLSSQQIVYGHTALLGKGEQPQDFLYPLPAMIFYAVFGVIDRYSARAIWMSVGIVSLCLLALISVRIVKWQNRPILIAGTVLFALGSYHSIRSIWMGNFSVVTALMVALGLLSIIQGHDVPAGIFLALSASNPMMVFLVIPFILLWALSNRRKELFWSTVLSEFVLLLAFTVLIPTWTTQWLRQILAFPTYSLKTGSAWLSLAGSMPGITQQLLIFFYGLTAIYLVIEWMIALRKDARWFLWTVYLTLVISNLASYRSGTEHFVGLIPVMVAIFSTWDQQWPKGGKYLVGFSLLALGVGIWLINWQGLLESAEPAALYFPLPLFCFVGLWWIRWWFIRPSRIPIRDLRMG